MKHIKLFEQYITEGIFNTYNELIGYEYKEFEKAFKKLNKNNVISYDKKDDVSYGFRKGSKKAFWKYFHEDGRLYHSERDKDALGLVNFFNRVKTNHPWG